MGLRGLLFDGAKLVLFYFELLIGVIANLAVGTGLMGAPMPVMWVSGLNFYK